MEENKRIFLVRDDYDDTHIGFVVADESITTGMVQATIREGKQLLGWDDYDVDELMAYCEGKLGVEFYSGYREVTV